MTQDSQVHSNEFVVPDYKQYLILFDGSLKFSWQLEVSAKNDNDVRYTELYAILVCSEQIGSDMDSEGANRALHNTQSMNQFYSGM